MGIVHKEDESIKIFLGYSVIALKRLGYSKKNIREFLAELNELQKIKTTEDAIEAIKDIEANDKMSDDSATEVCFEGIKIPIKYNTTKLSDLFEEYGFMGKEYNYMGKKICNALNKAEIIYIKDLHGRTKEDIMYIHVIGEISYNFFINCLNKIFCIL